MDLLNEYNAPLECNESFSSSDSSVSSRENEDEEMGGINDDTSNGSEDSSTSSSSSSSSSGNMSVSMDDSDSSSSEDSNSIPIITGMFIAAIGGLWRRKIRNQRISRRPRRIYRRLNWETHWNESINDPSFERDLRMKPASFVKLVDILKDSLQVDSKMAGLRGGEVSLPLCVYLTIRYLAGAPYIDIMRFLGISPVTFYRCLHKTLRAIVTWVT